MMIPSEFCVLPHGEKEGIYRRTVFTSALEGAWTGVGHREMVWCHQVRWRVARAALELGIAHSGNDKSTVLDRWLRDGSILPILAPGIGNSGVLSLQDSSMYETVPANTPFVLRDPDRSQLYLLPIPRKSTSSAVSSFKALVFVSQGAILPVSPQTPIPLRVEVLYCVSSPVLEEAGLVCHMLKPSSLKLIPNPLPGTTFPMPEEGSDESEGVVVFETDIQSVEEDTTGMKRWLGIRVMDADGRGWVVGGFAPEELVTISTSTMCKFTFSVCDYGNSQ